MVFPKFSRATVVFTTQIVAATRNPDFAETGTAKAMGGGETRVGGVGGRRNGAPIGGIFGAILGPMTRFVAPETVLVFSLDFDG